MGNNWELAFGGVALGSILTFIWGYFGKRIDWKHTANAALDAAIIQQRADVQRESQAIIDRLQTGQSDLWKMFREMQGALAECQRMHLDDAAKIWRLEREKAALADRVLVLERRVPGIDSDYDGIPS